MERPLSSFPNDILRVLQLMGGGLEDVVVYGSASTQRLFWPSDIDALKSVPVKEQAALLKSCVLACLKAPGVWIADIKAGEDPADASGAARWTVRDILRGYCNIDKGTKHLTLHDACAQSGALCKLDCVAFLPEQQRFSEFSMLYRQGGFKEDRASLLKDVKEKEKECAWLKVVKRLRSLFAFDRAQKKVDACVSILNSSAGQAGQIAGDLMCLETLFDYAHWPIPLSKVEQELDMVKFRASGVFGLSAAKEGKVAELCDQAQHIPSTRAGVAPLLHIVRELAAILQPFSNESAHRQLKQAGLC